MLLSVNLYEDLVDEKRVTVASVLSLQSACIDGSELDAPETDCFATNCDASFSEQVFDISMAEVESVVEPDGVRNDVGRESMAFICVHLPILTISGG
jgi:hypothetical protein